MTNYAGENYPRNPVPVSNPLPHPSQEQVLRSSFCFWRSSRKRHPGGCGGGDKNKSDSIAKCCHLLQKLRKEGDSNGEAEAGIP